MTTQKIQMKQSTTDGVKCKHEFKLNGESIWNKNVDCPATENTNTKHNKIRTKTRMTTLL